LAIQVAEIAAVSSCRYAAVTSPSYSTVTFRLPYGLKLSSSVTRCCGVPMNEMY